MLWWWIVAALIVLPLLGLAGVLAALRRRLVELERVAAAGQERVAATQPKLMASAERLQRTLVELERRSTIAQQRLVLLRDGQAAGQVRTGSDRWQRLDVAGR